MEKENIVFIPGLLCNDNLWKNQISFFKDTFDCIIADITECHDVKEMASALKEKLPTRFHLVGFSLDGWVAL